jgi:hypothetical protein
MEPLRVFISYSSKDTKWRESIKTYLAVLQQQQVITVWHNDKILPGSVWNAEIQKKLNEADIILFLVSADLLASEYFNNEELPKAMERRERDEARVIPVILGYCDWGNTPLGQLQALPNGGTPVTSWSNQDEAFTNIVQGIRRVCESLNSIQIINSSPINDSNYDNIFFWMELKALIYQNDINPRFLLKANMTFGKLMLVIQDSSITVVLRGGILKLKLDYVKFDPNYTFQPTGAQRTVTGSPQEPSFHYDKPELLDEVINNGRCLPIGFVSDSLGTLTTAEDQMPGSIDATFAISPSDVLAYDSRYIPSPSDPDKVNKLIMQSLIIVMELMEEQVITSCLSHVNLSM